MQQFLHAGRCQDVAGVTCVVSWAAPRHKGPGVPANPREEALNVMPYARASKSKGLRAGGRAGRHLGVEEVCAEKL